MSDHPLLYQCVTLADGRTGTIIDVTGPALIFEPEGATSPDDLMTITLADLATTDVTDMPPDKFLAFLKASLERHEEGFSFGGDEEAELAFLQGEWNLITRLRELGEEADRGDIEKLSGLDPDELKRKLWGDD